MERGITGVHRIMEVVVIRLHFRDMVLVETHEQGPGGQREPNP